MLVYNFPSWNLSSFLVGTMCPREKYVTLPREWQSFLLGWKPSMTNILIVQRFEPKTSP
jgi:hypothetical protein